MFKTVTLFAKVLLPLGALVVISGPMGAQADRAMTPHDVLAAVDTDRDGTIDENEVTTAAGAVFDKLDGDKDGTLDEKELQGRMNNRQFTEADPDNDKTLTKSEYIVFVTKAFRAANPDGDSTVDAKELQAPAGLILIRLLQ